jgi:hypothetical protein
MVNYNNGKVYKIQKIGGSSNIYVGSTTKQYLSQRFYEHKRNYKTHKKRTSKLFQLFDEFGVDNCEIVLLELVNCNSKDELLAVENYHICNPKPDDQNEYYVINKKLIPPPIKLSRKCMCECGEMYSRNYKSRHDGSKLHAKQMERLANSMLTNKRGIAYPHCLPSMPDDSHFNRPPQPTFNVFEFFHCTPQLSKEIKNK